ncbi:MAG: DUF6048 family protein [Bacteroidaceae bacterium]|nr:DUF6048 family protein [Bacteroidaceae bacterium]
MKRPLTCRYICFDSPLTLSLGRRWLVLLLVGLFCATPYAQNKSKEEKKDKAPLFSGVAVSADVVGFAMKAMNAKFANMEVSARINLYDKYFPVAELGIGDCSREGAETGNTFSATAPYMRFGLDYNFNKKHNGNRLFGIVRYGFSSFKYDIGNPTFTDPVYGTTGPLLLKGEKATGHWLELGVGVETKLWSFVRLGWSIRYKKRISLKYPDGGEPYFVPGFGKNDDNCFGGTVNLIFDVGKTKKKVKTPPVLPPELTPEPDKESEN